MDAVPDLQTIGLALAVLALLGWFFWHVAASYLNAAKRFSAWLDTGAQRQRDRIEHERIRGRPPLWLRSVRAALIAAMVGMMAYLVAGKLQIR